MSINVKVLPLQMWMTQEWMQEGMELKEIPVTYHRNGLYLLRSKSQEKCWFEVGNKAWLADGKQFRYELALYSHRPMRTTELQALNILITAKLGSKKLKNLSALDSAWHSNRDVYRDIRKFGMSMNAN